MNFKNFKFVSNIKGFAPKLKWTMLGGGKEYKIERKESIEQDNIEIENMVIAGLVKEFGEEIKNSKSFPLLVDAVVHNLKKKQVESIDVK